MSKTTFENLNMVDRAALREAGLMNCEMYNWSKREWVSCRDEISFIANFTYRLVLTMYGKLSKGEKERLLKVGKQNCDYYDSGRGDWVPCRPGTFYPTAIYRVRSTGETNRVNEVPQIKETKVKQEQFIAHAPAAIYIAPDGTKTIVKCSPDDTYDPIKGCMIAYYKSHHPKMTAHQMSELLAKIEESAKRPDRKKKQDPVKLNTPPETPEDAVEIKVQCDSKGEAELLDALTGLFK